MSSLVLLAAVAAALPAGTLAEHASQPTQPEAAQIDAGRNMTCALVRNVGVRCWGFSLEGGLGYPNIQMIGDNETPGAAGPVHLGDGATPSAIGVGDGHACALLSGGSVRCWGLASNGRLGYPGAGNIGDNETPGTAGPVDLDPGAGLGSAKSISAGGSHTCAVLADNSVRCWGYGCYGALGYGGGDPNACHNENPAPIPDVGDNETPGLAGPVDLDPGPGVGSATAISAGSSHTCALLEDGSVRCWGNGGNGQLGYGFAANRAVPGGAVQIGGAAIAISAGDYHTCAVLVGGSVRCWGEGLHGRLGYGGQDRIGDTEPPDSVPPLTFERPVVAISAGADHTCARLDDSSVRCWGFGLSGRLGYGNPRNIGDDPGELASSTGPVELGAGRNALAITAGGRHTCARLDDGERVSCWGYGGNGRLGYCNERNVGDDEVPGSVGPVPLDVAVRAPDAAYPGCVRPAAPGGPAPPPSGPPPAGDDSRAAALAAQARRLKALRSCLAKAGRHARLEIRRARRSSGRERAGLRRHIKRHRAQKRRVCRRRHGRTPGRIEGLTAQAASRVSVVLRFRAPGTDGNRPPAARNYVVKQSRRPIRGRRAFRRAQTLCKGRCRFPAATEVGGRLALTVEDLRPRTTYYYAVAARDNVSGRLGPRSAAVKVRTR